jgi:DNA repair protein RecO (recombination protein O)
MTHKTKGIVLRTIQYGETSIITSVYTELFGLQSYIVKGVRQPGKKVGSKQAYFQPAAMLEMEVYHNHLKNLQFIKEYKWSYLYHRVFFDVVRNAIAQFMIELVHQTVKQPEANPELFYLLEGSLLHADKGSDPAAANLPLYFIIRLAAGSGFQLQGSFSKETPALELKEGMYIYSEASHRDIVTGSSVEIISKLQHTQSYNGLENITLNQSTRRQILDVLLHYASLHLTDLKELKSLAVMQQVLD